MENRKIKGGDASEKWHNMHKNFNIIDKNNG